MKDRIIADMRSAQKKREKLRLSTIRMLLSEIKYAEIKKGEAITDEEIIGLVSREIKKRKEAIPQYKKGMRPDLVEKEELEEKILREYMPEQLDDKKIDELVDEAIKQSGATNVKELGKVMGALMPKVKDRADGELVNKKVKARLENVETD